MMSELGRVCDRRKLRVNVGKSKVIRCSRYCNGGLMNVILNGKSFGDAECLNTWSRKWQLMVDVN